MSEGFCVPYSPILYSPLLWAQHVAAAEALAPAAAEVPRAGLGQPWAIAPAAEPAVGPALAPIGLLGRSAGIESISGSCPVSSCLLATHLKQIC